MEPTIERFRYPFFIDFENDADEVNVRLNSALNDIDQVWITGYDIANGSSRRIKIKVVENDSFFHPPNQFGTTRLGAVDLRDPFAFYIKTPTSAGGVANVEFGEKRLFMQTQTVLNSTANTLKIRVTDWSNQTVTYDDLTIWGYFTKREPVRQVVKQKRPDPAALGTLNTWND